MKQRLFLDLDGTLAEWIPCSTLENLYQRGYFFRLRPNPNILDAVRELQTSSHLELFVLSAVLSDNPYALNEKKAWVKKYLGFPIDHQIYCPCNADKSNYIPGGIQENDILLDDYTKNLMQWKGIPIKFINQINGKNGVFPGPRISMKMTPHSIAQRIITISKRTYKGELNESPIDCRETVTKKSYPISL